MHRERKQTREAGPQMLRAMIDTASINVEARTLEVTFATDNPVRMYSWDDGYVNEVLSFEAGHVRWDRINAGGPVLDNHQRWGSIADTQIGVVEKAWAEGGKGRAKLRFAKDEKAELIWQRVQDGIIRNISVGYNVFSYVKTEREGQLTEYRAIDWEPNEISFVPVPADYTAGVRNEGDVPKHQVTIFSPNTNQRAMTIEQKRAEVARLKGLATRTADEDQQLRQLEADIATHERANPPAPPAPTPAPAPTVDVAAERAAAATAERQRGIQIIAAVRAAKLGDEFAEELISAGHSIEKARELIIAKFAEGDADGKPKPGNRAAVTADGTDKRRAAMQDALALRSGQAIEKPAEGARDFRGMSLLRMAEEALIAEGIKVRGLSAREIAETALNLRSSPGYHSTSDFPIILGNTVNRSLRAAYDLQPRTFQPFTRRTTANDFREMTKAQISGLVDKFEKVKEGGEYKYATVSEAKESYKVEKFGRMIAITWETIVNDDLDAFSRIPAAIAAKAAQKQSDIIYGILLDNPNMSDAKALFHADHGNLGAASAIVEAGLSAARKAMRTQKSIEGDFINVAPRYMVVGPDKETEAQKLLQAAIIATKTADTNVFRGFTELIVEPRVTGNKWFLSADPATIDTIEYAFLEGEGELFTEQRTGFDIDGLEIKARMVFGAKAIDWRGLYYNPGA